MASRASGLRKSIGQAHAIASGGYFVQRGGAHEGVSAIRGLYFTTPAISKAVQSEDCDGADRMHVFANAGLSSLLDT
jgi:hypothetical protein